MDWAERKAREIMETMCGVPRDDGPDPETVGINIIAAALRAERATLLDQFAMAALPATIEAAIRSNETSKEDFMITAAAAAYNAAMHMVKLRGQL